MAATAQELTETLHAQPHGVIYRLGKIESKVETLEDIIKEERETRRSLRLQTLTSFITILVCLISSMTALYIAFSSPAAQVARQQTERAAHE